MRKTSVRRFIHAVLDVLPLLIIPIFALNILHKETEPISIEVQEKVSVDFNQYFDTTKSYTTYNCNVTLNDGIYSLVPISSDINTFFQIPLNNIDNNHKYLVKYNVLYSNGTQIATRIRYPYVGDWFYSLGTNEDIKYNDITTQQYIGLQFQPYSATLIQFNDLMCFDLTKMFGEGNEPTIEEFNSMFPNSYYEYTESQKMLVNKPNPTTYNDTDIGSQFVYALYKPVHDYFNFNNLFNMGAIYNWIELNLFSGTAPLPIFIIWNVIVYEFFIDLIFLMYSLFMFIIDWSTNMIDKFLYRSRS